MSYNPSAGPDSYPYPPLSTRTSESSSKRHCTSMGSNTDDYSYQEQRMRSGTTSSGAFAAAQSTVDGRTPNQQWGYASAVYSAPSTAAQSTGLLQMTLKLREAEWLALLYERPSSGNADEVEKWIERVMNVSEPSSNDSSPRFASRGYRNPSNGSLLTSAPQMAASSDAMALAGAQVNQGSSYHNPGLRFPCKARGVPNEHNARNAYIDVPPNANHGDIVVCSHPFCVSSGRKFRFCTVCHIPVAKRNFSKRHDHGLLSYNAQEKDSTEQAERQTERQHDAPRYPRQPSPDDDSTDDALRILEDSPEQAPRMIESKGGLMYHGNYYQR